MDIKINQSLLHVLDDNRNLMQSQDDLKQEVKNLREEKVTHISDSFSQYQNTENFKNHIFQSFENLRLVTHAIEQNLVKTKENCFNFETEMKQKNLR